MLGVIDAGVVVLLDRALRKRGDFGWYSYSPMPRRYADYLAPEHVLSGWAAVGVVAGALISVNAIAVAAYLLIRRRASDR